MRRRLFIMVSALTLLCGVGAASAVGAPLAHAASSFCTLTSPADCLNDWNNLGAGNMVRLEPINGSNENFVYTHVPGRCGGAVSAASQCPFSNSYFDNYYNSWPIVQLEYGNTGLCLATGSASNGTEGLGVLGSCNNTSSGSGGSNGTLFVDHNGFMINVYWTNHQSTNNAACMEPEGGTGANSFIYLRLPTGDGCAGWSPF